MFRNILLSLNVETSSLNLEYSSSQCARHLAVRQSLHKAGTAIICCYLSSGHSHSVNGPTSEAPVMSVPSGSGEQSTISVQMVLVA